VKRKGRDIGEGGGGGGGDFFLGRNKRDTIGGYKLGDNINDKNPRRFCYFALVLCPSDCGCVPIVVVWLDIEILGFEGLLTQETVTFKGR